MQAIGGAAMMFLQEDPARMTHDVHLITIYVAILAISVAVLVLCMLIAGAVIGAVALRGMRTVERLEQRAAPIMDKANKLMAEFTPKLRTVADNVEHISTVARGKVDEVGDTVTQVNRTVQEANGRTRAQVERVDGMVSHALTATEEIAERVERGIRKPVRQIAGVVAAVKVGLETLIERSPLTRWGGVAPRTGRASQTVRSTPVEPVDTVNSGRPYGVE
jgi:uncharacterized protein YoxC